MPSEGSATLAELAFLMDLASRPGDASHLRDRVDAGVSADGFLRANELAQIASFNIGTIRTSQSERVH